MNQQDPQAHMEYTHVRQDETKDRMERPTKKKVKIDPNFAQSIAKYIKDDKWKQLQKEEKSKKSLFIHQQVPSEMQL